MCGTSSDNRSRNISHSEICKGMHIQKVENLDFLDVLHIHSFVVVGLCMKQHFHYITWRFPVTIIGGIIILAAVVKDTGCSRELKAKLVM